MYIFELRSPKKRKMKAKYLERRGFTNPKQVKTGKYAFHFEVEVDDSDLKKQYAAVSGVNSHIFITINNLPARQITAGVFLTRTVLRTDVNIVIKNSMKIQSL